MSQLSDTIERFIMELMAEDGEAELQRNKLASQFQCGALSDQLCDLYPVYLPAGICGGRAGGAGAAISASFG